MSPPVDCAPPRWLLRLVCVLLWGAVVGIGWALLEWLVR